MIKCQTCSGVHEHTDDCRKPLAVLKHIAYKDLRFFVPLDESYLQVWAAHETGNTAMRGRKWRLSEHMTRSEIVQTALMAVLAWEEHEAREHFTYRGQKVFGPHFNVEALVKLCEQGQLEVRA